MKTVKHLTRRTFLTIVGGVATVGAAVGIGSSLLHRKEEAGHPAPLRDEPPITVQDDFSTTTKGYLPLYLQGSKGGSMTVAANTLHLQLSQEHTTYALAHPQVISGHFYAEIEFDTDQSVGLALIAQRDGKPDPQNFTSINIDTNLMSDVLAQVIDRQHGKDNVRDNTGLLESPETRYQTTLNGLGFSVPFSGTRKKIRILRDGPAGFFHFYYKVGKKVTESAAGGWPATQDAEDWLELAPSRDWNPAGTHFYIAPYVRTASAQTASIKFKQLFATNMPKVDQSDVQTGFKAVQRDYHWSGYAGNAYVVTFGKHFPYQDKGYKFVFWDRANYEPAWHFTNNLLYSYEHLETWQIWGFQGTACFEPMSDRLLRWSKVEIVEDNAVRKVLKWSYVLCNPNYLVPDEGTGRQLPIAIEYYTFYPDGTGTRRMRYYPKLDANENNWHELAELMVIKGTQENKNPVDYIADPVFTAANLEGKQIDYSMQWYLDPNHGDIFGRSDQKTIQDWKQMILVSHLKGTPDPY
ncbi:MAG TPA: hypothetical protein VKX46_19495, partial [Ktedonobacteraceae bacterium]|nr:hypothetical protein [Ktedonobacteraceae bacterium]